MASPKPLKIDQYYDRHTRSWVTMVIDSTTGYQISDALYDGTRKDAAASKEHLRRQIKMGLIR